MNKVNRLAIAMALAQASAAPQPIDSQVLRHPEPYLPMYIEPMGRRKRKWPRGKAARRAARARARGKR